MTKNTETHKHCPKCQQVKLRSEFYKNKNAHDGLQGYCKPCSIATVRELHQKDPKKHSDYNKKWDKANPQKKRDNHLKWRLGIPYGTYDRLFTEQEGKCAICGRTDSGNSRTTVFHTDHCAETGNVRGLLCRPCNIGIGHFFHRVEFLQAAIDYLIRTLR